MQATCLYGSPLVLFRSINVVAGVAWCSHATGSFRNTDLPSIAPLSMKTSEGVVASPAEQLESSYKPQKFLVTGSSLYPVS